MSNHARLILHQSEEAVSVNTSKLLERYPGPNTANAITDYFAVSNNLLIKIARTAYADDSEILGLLLLGVVSAAEFYFRSVLGAAITVCPLCALHAEGAHVPIGSYGFYRGSGYSHAMAAFEHESLADAKKIKTECKKLTGFDLTEDSSANKAISDFEILCELRHCLVHARGFAGLKACKALGAEQRSLQKLLVGKAEALELVKLSHNAVRALNRFLADSIVNRWVERDVLNGVWNSDKALFVSAIEAFWIKGEDSYNGIAWNAYKPFRRAIVARRKAIGARVSGTS